MVMAADITDEQIRELHLAFVAEGNWTMARYCDRALSHHMREARARCAEIWNARQNGGTK